jgi:hypothetical protein
MSERSFKRYLKKHYKNFRFKKNHLDACSVCLRIKNLKKRAHLRQEYNVEFKSK